MRISGSGQYQSYYDLQKSKTRQDEGESNPNQISVQEANQAEMDLVKEEKSAVAESDLEKSSIKEMQQYQISHTFCSDEDLHVGKSSEIERAISAMEKDEVLKQYNFFVSSAEHEIGRTGFEPMPLENFELDK